MSSPVERPFVILVIGEFDPDPVAAVPLRYLAPVELENCDVDALMQVLAPRVVMRSAKSVDGTPLEVAIRSMRELSPHGLAEKSETIARLRAIRALLPHLRASAASGQPLPAVENLVRDPTTSWIDELRALNGCAEEEGFRQRATALSDRLRVAPDNESKLADLECDEMADLLDRSIGRAIAVQVQTTFAARELQDLLSTWYGLAHLAARAKNHDNVRILAWNVSKKRLVKDFQRAVEFDQTELFRLLYENRLQTRDNLPVSLVVLDHEFGRSDGDFEVLRRLAWTGAAAGAPIIVPLAPSMMGLVSWKRLHSVRNVSRTLDGTNADLARWHALRADVDSQYLCLTLPRVLAAWIPFDGVSPSDPATRTQNGGRGHDVWSSASWFLAGWLLDAGAAASPCSLPESVDQLAIEGLTRYEVRDEDGSVRPRVPTEVTLRDTLSIREVLDLVHPRELCQAGFVPLCVAEGGRIVVPALNSVLGRELAAETDGSRSRPVGTLNYLIPLWRVAHAATCYCRDHANPSEFGLREDLDRLVREWALDAGSAGGRRAQASPFSRAHVELRGEADARSRGRHVVIELELGPRTADPGQVMAVKIPLPWVIAKAAR